MKQNVLAAREQKRTEAAAARDAAAGDGLLDRVISELTTPPNRGGAADDTLAEELAYHRVLGGLDAKVAAAVEGSPGRFSRGAGDAGGRPPHRRRAAGAAPCRAAGVGRG